MLGFLPSLGADVAGTDFWKAGAASEQALLQRRFPDCACVINACGRAWLPGRPLPILHNGSTVGLSKDFVPKVSFNVSLTVLPVFLSWKSGPRLME